MKLLESLSLDQRGAAAAVLGDLSLEQVAEALGADGAIKQLQRRGLIAVRKVLAQKGVTP